MGKNKVEMINMYDPDEDVGQRDIPLATHETPGIAAFNEDDFDINTGKVKLKYDFAKYLFKIDIIETGDDYNTYALVDVPDDAFLKIAPNNVYQFMPIVNSSKPNIFLKVNGKVYMLRSADGEAFATADIAEGYVFTVYCADTSGILYTNVAVKYVMKGPKGDNGKDGKDGEPGPKGDTGVSIDIVSGIYYDPYDLPPQGIDNLLPIPEFSDTVEGAAYIVDDGEIAGQYDLWIHGVGGLTWTKIDNWGGIPGPRGEQGEQGNPGIPVWTIYTTIDSIVCGQVYIVNIDEVYPNTDTYHALLAPLQTAFVYNYTDDEYYIAQIESINNILNKIEISISSPLRGPRGEQGASSNLGYDLTITTQEEFEAFYATLDDGTCEAHSVLFVGDGGTLKFTRSDGKGLHLPPTLFRLDGMGKVIIDILDFVYNEENKAGVWYSNRYGDHTYSIDSMELYVSGDSNGYGGVYGFYNCANLTDCICDVSVDNPTGKFGRNAYAFYDCVDLMHCGGTASIDGTGGASYSVGFYTCSNLVNCSASAITEETAAGATARGFHGCSNLVNCKTYANQLYGSEYYGYYNCSYCSNCSAPSVHPSKIWGGTTIKRDDDSCEV